MYKSEPILPIRFYDDLFDQQRFSKQCVEYSQLELVYPSLALPNFQLTRASKYELPTKFFLRNTCEDLNNNFWKVIPEIDTIFGNSSASSIFGAFPIDGQFSDAGPPRVNYIAPFLKIDCANLIPTQPINSNTIMQSSVMVIPVLANSHYSFKLIVDKFILSVGSAFAIKIYTGGISGTLHQAIYGPGIYNYDILTGLTDLDITIEFENFQFGDDFSISYIQAILNSFYTLQPNDVSLLHGQLKVFPMVDGTDIIVYCGDPYATTYNIPKGEYYFVINSGLDYYVSEPFKIVTLKEIENYFKLTWWNVCDINKENSVLYSVATLGCSYRNILYLDSDLFKPEYETIEEGEENGTGDLSVQFQKWRKNLNFEVGKSPEFLTDALSGIFLHDNIFIKKPLNYKQEILNNEYPVLKVTNNISQVLDDCFQNVKLKFLLEDKFIDTGCCTVASVFDCNASVWTVTNVYPSISSVTLVWFWYVITGLAIPNSFAIIEYNYNGAGWVIADTVQADSSGNVTYYLPFYIVSGATDFKIRIRNVTLNCELGTSDVYDLV